MNRIVLRSVFAVIALFCLLSPAGMRSQESGSKPETQAPTPAQATPTQVTAAPAPAATTPAPHPDNDYWRKHDELLKVDFGGLGRFKEADAALPPPAKGENRVVFMGDSITEGWNIRGRRAPSRASHTSTGASAGKPRRRCWCASART